MKINDIEAILDILNSKITEWVGIADYDNNKIYYIEILEDNKNNDLKYRITIELENTNKKETKEMKKNELVRMLEEIEGFVF